MIGLIFLFIIGAYLMIVIAAPYIARRTAKAFSAPPAAMKWAGLAGFLAVTLPIFWDWIPTVVAHNYYCKKDAGVFIYKTVEQWKVENPGVAEGLSANYKKDSQKINDGRRYFVNERIASDRKTRTHTWRIQESEDSIVDLKTNDVLALHRDYNTGVYGGNMVGGTGGGLRDWKLWMKYSSCEPGDPDPSLRVQAKKMDSIRATYYALGEKK